MFLTLTEFWFSSVVDHGAYGIDADEIDIIPYKVVNSIKITFPRQSISGSLCDFDVYGCQMHMPLANIEI